LQTRSKGVREIGVDILANVDRRRDYVDRLLERAFKTWDVSPVDRNLLVELVSGTLRRRGSLDWILGQLYHGDYSRTPGALKSVLRLSLYQLKYLDRVPDYAVVSEAVEIAKRQGGQRWGRTVNAILRAYGRRSAEMSFPENAADPLFALSVRYSHPEWLLNRWLDRYGLERTIRFCEYNNRRPALSLRVNFRKMDREAALQRLCADGFDVVRSEMLDDFIKVKKGGAGIIEHELFASGVLAVQDESTALPPRLLSVKPGDRILDLCAAPGGKTCHLAHLTGDRAQILATDISRKRLQRLRENLARFELTSVEIRRADDKLLEEPPFDKILLDAPCSGLGVLSRRSDLRWQRQLEDIGQAQETQLSLIDRAARLLRPGGVLVYSTCSLEPEETSMVVETFLANHGDFQADTDFCLEIQSMEGQGGFWRTWPFEHRMDGSFAARLIRTK